MAVIFLKEKIMRFEYVSMVIAFCGVMLVAFAKSPDAEEEGDTTI